MSDSEIRPPVPPFSEETARQKVQAAEDAWNTCDPERVALAYTVDSEWRNRDGFFTGRDAIVGSCGASGRGAGLPAEQGAVGFAGKRISVRFEYEWRDQDGQWWRSHGNEHWEFDPAADAPPRREHQRHPDRRERAPHPLELRGRGDRVHRGTPEVAEFESRPPIRVPSWIWSGWRPRRSGNVGRTPVAPANSA